MMTTCLEGYQRGTSRSLRRIEFHVPPVDGVRKVRFAAKRCWSIALQTLSLGGVACAQLLGSWCLRFFRLHATQP